MPGPKGYFQTTPVSDEPAPPGAFDVITFTTLTVNRIVVGDGAHTVKIGGATLSSGGGGAADIKAIEDAALRLYGGDGSAGSGNLGGAIEIQPGNPDGPNTGAGVTIYGGNAGATGNGGVITIQAGGASDGSGGGLIAKGGTAGGANGGGFASFEGGAAGTVGTGGDAHVVGGPGGSVSGAGGPVYVEGGAPTSGAGGFVQIAGGGGAGGNNVGGAVTITAGSSAGTGVGANVTIIAGAGGGGGLPGNGGEINLTSGAGGAGGGSSGTITIACGTPVEGNGGTLSVLAGHGVGTNRTGGALNLNAGNSTGNQTGGTASLNGGAGGADGGIVAISGGTAGTGNHGQVQIGVSNTLGVAFGILTTAQITADQDNYAGFDDCVEALTSTDATRNITGIANGFAGRKLRVTNTGANSLTFAHQSGSSSAANQITCPGSTTFTLTAGYSCDFVYDGTTSKWILETAAGGSSGVAGFSNVCYVDVAGNDGTGVRGDPSKPFLTVNAALAATTTAGDLVLVGPGAFAGAITWDTESRALAGSGANVTTLGNISSSLTGGASTTSSFKDFSCGSFTLTSTKGGASILTLDFANISAGSTTITGRSNGQDRINCANFSVPAASFTVVNVPGNYVGVRGDGVVDITNNTSRVVSLEACNCDGGTLTLSGSGQINVSGGVYSDLTCNNSGTFLLSGCLVNGNTTINGTCTVSVSGCRLAGSIAVASGATFVPKGYNFAASGLTSSAAPGTVNLTYWGGTVVVTAAATLTLPARAHNGYVINVKNGNAAGSGSNVTVARNGNNIDGVAADAVLGPLQSLTLIGDGTNWWAI